MGGATQAAGLAAMQALDFAQANQILFNTTLQLQSIANQEVQAQAVNNATIGAGYTQNANKIRDLGNTIVTSLTRTLGEIIIRVGQRQIKIHELKTTK